MRIISVPIGNGRAPAIGEGHRDAAQVCAHEWSSHVSGDEVRYEGLEGAGIVLIGLVCDYVGVG